MRSRVHTEKNEKKEEKSHPLPGNGSEISKSPVAGFMVWWAGEYQRRYGTTYAFSYAKDGKTIKDLLSHCDNDVERLKARALRFLSADDGFVRQSGHTVGIFKTRFNSLGEYLAETAPPVAEQTKTQRLLQGQL